MGFQYLKGRKGNFVHEKDGKRLVTRALGEGQQY